MDRLLDFERAPLPSEVVYLDSVSPWDPRTCLYVYERFRTLRATTEVSEASHCCSSTRRDARSTQPLAERMTLQPVVTRDDHTHKTGKHATRSVYIHTRACAASHGTLTPMLHLTTSQTRSPTFGTNAGETI